VIPFVQYAADPAGAVADSRHFVHSSLAHMRYEKRAFVEVTFEVSRFVRLAAAIRTPL